MTGIKGWSVGTTNNLRELSALISLISMNNKDIRVMNRLGNRDIRHHHN